MTDEELKATGEIKGLSEETLTVVKGKFRDHLCLLMNLEGKKLHAAVDDMLHEFKKLGLA